eukprot:8280615-Pyramimonas_sp.AAC.1
MRRRLRRSVGLVDQSSLAVSRGSAITCRARARELGEPLGAAAEAGASVARQLQELFDQGENLIKGENLVAGLGHFLPEFGQ